MADQEPLFTVDTTSKGPVGEKKPDRKLPQGCQVERLFTDDEWMDFIACAQRVWESGDFRHRDFEAHVNEFHPETNDESIRNAIWEGATLIAYRNDGMERVALYDPRSSFIIVACLGDGIRTAYEVSDFEIGMMSKTNRRWLREL